MDLKHHLHHALLLLALLLTAHCQDAIIEPDRYSLVTKGKDFLIVWRLLAPLAVSNVSIALTNPHVELGGSLGTITRQVTMAVGGRERDAGSFLSYYEWLPDESLPTSDAYRVRVVDGNVTLDSQSFYIGSEARSGPSAAVVAGAVGGALGAVIVVGVAVVVWIVRRRGWALVKRGGSGAGGGQQGGLGAGGADGVVCPPVGAPSELEGSLGRYEYFNRHNSELPGSPVLEGAVPDLIQQQEQEDRMFIARRLSMFKV